MPKATLDALAENPAQLKSVLLYHVVSGRVTAADVVQLSSAKTLEGRSLAIKVVDGSVFVDQAKVTTPDVMASNGVIHVIDSVLIPKTAPAAGAKNIVKTAVSAGQFKTLASLLTKAGLAGTLQGTGPFTVFAPTDAAFAKVPKATLAALAKDKAKLRAVLLYHVVKGKVTAARAMKLRSAKTLKGKRWRSALRQQGARWRGYRHQGRCDRLERRHPRDQQRATLTGPARAARRGPPRRAATKEVQPDGDSGRCPEQAGCWGGAARTADRSAPLERRHGRAPFRAGRRNARPREHVLAARNEFVPADEPRHRQARRRPGRARPATGRAARRGVPVRVRGGALHARLAVAAPLVRATSRAGSTRPAGSSTRSPRR